MKYRFIKIIILIILLIIIPPSCHKKNHPPYAPYTPSGPITGLVTTNYDFSSLAVDQDGDSVALRFSWKDGDTSDWSELVPTGEIVSMSYSWSIPDTYYVKAQSKDMKGLISEWSLPLIVKIVDNLPPVPSIPSGLSTGYVDSNYQFSGSATDPEEDSIAIRFDWGNGDTSDWSTWVASGTQVWTTHFWSAIDTFYIRAQAKDKKDEISPWSSAHPIVIVLDTVKLYPNHVVVTIPVGLSPSGIVALPNDSFIYVTNFNGRFISVIRTSDNKVVDSIPIGYGALFLTVLPNGNYIYFTQDNTAGVSVIRTLDNTVVDEIQVGSTPYELTCLPNGNYIYVANCEDDNVSVIRTLDNTVVSTIPVGDAPNGTVALPNSNYVYVTNISSDNVSVIRTSDNSIIDSIPVGDDPEEIEFLSDGKVIYITNSNSNDVTDIDP